MIKIFTNYVSNFDMEDPKIKEKYNHSLRVMSLCNLFAKSLGFNEYDIKLATLIGLLHDFGRFEQVKQYNTFFDTKSVDHADFGVDILFNKEYINEYWTNEDDYELIKYSITNHNKLNLEKSNDRYEIFGKLIRDTDKIDILNVILNHEIINIELDLENITKEVDESFKNYECVNIKDLKNKNDRLILRLALVFDINYDISYEYLYKYYKQMESKFCNEVVKPYYDILFKFMEEKMNYNSKKIVKEKSN